MGACTADSRPRPCLPNQISVSPRRCGGPGTHRRSLDLTLRPSTQLTRPKSSHSDKGHCAEVASTHEPILVRDSKNSTGPVLRFAPRQWRTFTQASAIADAPPAAREQ
ncbi:DUF397 domain-containing protein [Micromonospora chalcea]|uniref:DUF397 domain-containing protein n=1 Tax=Micromonospora chalcea TaxID=1874 RepID=UPI003720DA49